VRRHRHDNTSAHTVEGYLLARAHHDQAHREADDLCARMPWLTTAQAEDLTHHYVEQRLQLSRQLLRDAADRAAHLRQEYEDRYVGLRRDLFRRHTAGACAVVAFSTAIGTLTALLAR